LNINLIPRGKNITVIPYINNNNNPSNILLINIFYIFKAIISLIFIFYFLLKGYKVDINLKGYIFTIGAKSIISFFYYNGLFIFNIIYKL